MGSRERGLPVATTELPPGVTLAAWALERNRWQNPRIRAFMGCIRLIEEVQESNFAILHCSPARLARMWERIQQVVHAIKNDIAPLLKPHSAIPKLEAALREVQLKTRFLDRELLRELQLLSEKPSDDELDNIRPTICVAMGKLYTFLLDTLGELLSGDPRSQFDADYFLSRKFSKDVEESEWLHLSVTRLEQYLRRIDDQAQALLVLVAERLAAHRRVPTPEQWRETSLFLEELTNTLAPMLRKIIGLGGIRIDELLIIEAHSRKIPANCHVLNELFDTACATLSALGAEQPSATSNLPGLKVAHAVMSTRIVGRMRDLEHQIGDLVAFIPLWRTGLSQRRALMLRHPK
jgi:hypothetical protein